MPFHRARRARSDVQCAMSQRATSDRLNGQPSYHPVCPGGYNAAGEWHGATYARAPLSLSILVRPVSFSDDGLVSSGGFRWTQGEPGFNARPSLPTMGVAMNHLVVDSLS